MAAEIFERLQADGFQVRLAGDKIGVIPAKRLSPETKKLVLEHREELLTFLRQGRTWPAARGRDGVLRDPAAVWSAIGRRARLKGTPAARIGTLFAVSFDTISGSLRCRLRFPEGGDANFWPEEIEIEER